MEVSLSFMAWLTVLLIQVIVHIKVVYLRKERDEYVDEPRMTENDNESSENSWAESMIENKMRQSHIQSLKMKQDVYQALSDNPALEDDYADDFEDDDDEPPNLQQRLSQTGEEMMLVSDELCQF